jgi:hypothetical protein
MQKFFSLASIQTDLDNFFTIFQENFRNLSKSIWVEAGELKLGMNMLC